MNKKALVFLAEGFEEIEAITPIDVLRRAGIDVLIVSVQDTKNVIGAHGIAIQADSLISEVDNFEADLLVLPGGALGTKNLGENEQLRTVLLDHADGNKLLAAICAAPSVLGQLGLLKGKKATCYPGWEHKLTGALYENESCIVADSIVTARGVGAAMEFSLKLVELLQTTDAAEELARTMVVID